MQYLVYGIANPAFDKPCLWDCKLRRFRRLGVLAAKPFVVRDRQSWGLRDNLFWEYAWLHNQSSVYCTH